MCVCAWFDVSGTSKSHLLSLLQLRREVDALRQENTRLKDTLVTPRSSTAHVFCRSCLTIQLAALLLQEIEKDANAAAQDVINKIRSLDSTSGMPLGSSVSVRPTAATAEFAAPASAGADARHIIARPESTELQLLAIATCHDWPCWRRRRRRWRRQRRRWRQFWKHTILVNPLQSLCNIAIVTPLSRSPTTFNTTIPLSIHHQVLYVLKLQTKVSICSRLSHESSSLLHLHSRVCFRGSGLISGRNTALYCAYNSIHIVQHA